MFAVGSALAADWPSWRGVNRDGVDSGQIKVSEPELMARLLYHGTDGVLHDAIMSVTGLKEKEVLRAVRELYIKVFDAPVR